MTPEAPDGQMHNPEQGVPFGARKEGRYAIRGVRVIDRLGQAKREFVETGDHQLLVETVLDTLAYQEGISQIELFPNETNAQTLVSLRNKFLTVETGIKQDNDGNLDGWQDITVKDTIAEANQFKRDVRRAKIQSNGNAASFDEGMRNIRERWAENGVPLTPQEEAFYLNQDAINELVGLENQIEARKVVTQAFLQRQVSCHSSKKQSEIGETSVSYTPDSSHWAGFFQSEPGWGNLVDGVMRKMVDVVDKSKPTVVGLDGQPLPKDLFAEGFKNTPEFKRWFDVMLKEAGGRVDVVWNAWKVMLLWEVPSMYGMEVDGDKYKFGTPPLISAMMSDVIHNEEHRAHEYGWKAGTEKGNNPQRRQMARYVGKSGYPMSIGRVPQLCGSFLHETTVKINGKDKSLFDLWYKDGKKFSDIGNNRDKGFPWIEADDPTGDDDEPAGAMSSWFLKRGRAHRVFDDLAGRPEMRDLSNMTKWEDRVRDWDKLKIGPKSEDDRIEPERNPRVLWIQGILIAHSINKNSDERRIYSSPLDEDTIANGDINTKTFMVKKDIINVAYTVGFIRKSDFDYLNKVAG